MHLLATSSATLDDLAEPIDLAQKPADVVALSFSDSDLAGIAAAWRADTSLPSLRLAALRDLRHPMSVDLWIDSVASNAKVVLVRILGGYDWWRYGCDRLAAVAREKGIALALLPGECCEEDARLDAASTVAKDELDRLLAFFREGGPDNMAGLAARLFVLAGGAADAPEAKPVPKAGYYLPGKGVVELKAFFSPFTGRRSRHGDEGQDRLSRVAPPLIRPFGPPSPRERGEGKAIIPILFYRSMLLAADAAPIDALFAALEKRGMEPVPIFVASLKDRTSLAFVEDAIATLAPAAIVATTAFASGAEPGSETLFDRAGVPVFQAIVATTRREAWAENQRGLAPADLAMHVVLPELDGRILGGAIAFKSERPLDEELGFRGQENRPEPDRVESLADRLSAMIRLTQTPRGERRLAILIPDYPNATGRTGYAVGLDVPESVLAMLRDLQAAGYSVGGIPESSRELLESLREPSAGSGFEDYRNWFSQLPEKTREKVISAWGNPEPANDLAFRFEQFGNVTVALAPDRGRSADRRADYHDPELPPRHELLAFGHWLQADRGCHAIVHVGAHGTLEWLPGKAVALSSDCFPEIVTGGLPVVYPFIVSNPGEAAHAKRRIAAVTLGHLPPPLVGAELGEAERKLEHLVDEYAQADGLDRRRRDRLAKLIADTARETGLAREAGIADDLDADEALQKIDAWLCDIKDFALKDGQHVYGRAAPGETDPLRLQSAAREREALIAALDGRHIRPGPAGAPARGRTDVLPTGRNLFTADPRTMPTPTAYELGRLAADEVVRRFLQDHGDWPRSLVMDLWGSASLRTGGEEIAQGLNLMGVKPVWDAATGRVTGVEVQPLAQLGRPRVDVTWKISGLFRDMFPAQIALLDAAARAVAARDEDGAENPLAAEARQTGAVPPRIFGGSPGTYGAGVEDLLATGDWQERAEIGQAYLDATSHAYGGAEGDGAEAPQAFSRRVAEAQLLVHTGDDPGRDILDGSADAAHVGGFAAAIAALGRSADLITLDTTDPARPRARTVAEAVARVVRGRAVSPRFIEGQLRHGPRGAAEFAETVDRLVAFAETTLAIPETLLEAVHDAYLGDERVRDFLLRENPAAARAIAERFAAARRRGLWHPRRNSIDDGLAELIAEARAREAA
ncbi:cobaltochelatase subunit CobN [Mesorhizobium sp. Z1-4]|uniref:cobaltochelatase subunit CobN n=1 Tax=Mesorhizobium sp. Z1-4 TaxID=2448478 RepID=UPI000FD81C91|nr:cobaltochelatase subunit CobN [Mesorhizobium sp. Z1-4]